MTKPLLSWSVCALLGACVLPTTSSDPNATGAPTAFRAAKTGAGETVDPHSTDKLFATLWMLEGAEYEAACRQAFANAAVALEAALQQPRVEAMASSKDPQAKVAVITDLDETILNNVAYQQHLVRDGVDFGGGGWGQWVDSGRAGLLPGAAEFLQFAIARGVQVFYVSNRNAPDHEAATVAALAEVDPGLSHERSRLLLQAKDATSDKEVRRQAVAKDHRVVLLLGDDLGDFVSVPKVGAEQGIAEVVEKRRRLVRDAAGRWGHTWILLPNPAYGSWARVYANDQEDPELSHRNRQDRLRAAGAFAPGK